MKPQLIDNAKDGWKFWSVRLNVLGTAVLAVFTFWPDSALQLWAAMPAEAKAAIPPQYTQSIAIFIFVMSTVARFLKQRKLNEAAK